MISTKQIGDYYEYYVLDHIKTNFDTVWHWKNVPEYVLYELNIIKDYNIFSKYRYDIGADLVAKKDNIYYFIQCKNFKETILMEQLAGFYFLLYEYNLSGILYYNGKLSQRVKDLSTGKINFINLPFNNQTFITNINNNIKLVPKEYQIEAYNILKNYDKTILSLPCGMGKTFTASLLAINYDNIIILSPLRYLAQQTLINMNNYLDGKYNPILISMDGSRNIENIKEFIKNKNIFSCTYDSTDIMIQLLDQLHNTYLIIDEFHNLSYNDINNDDNYIKQLMNRTNKHLYLSATPIKDFICDYKYVYKWKDAIDNKYICDFDIIIHDDNKELYDFVYLMNKLCSSELNKKLIAKSYFILKGLLYNGNRKCICYVTSINKAQQINDILYWMSKFLNIILDKWMITYNTSRTNRYKYLSEFKTSKNLSIMINVHILDEGIDIPECDSVYITQPNNNIINIVQRMCRANRITDNKKKCQIYLWCSKNKTDKILNYLLDNTESIILEKVFKLKLTNNSIIINNHKLINNNINPIIIQSSNIIDFLNFNLSIDHQSICDFFKNLDNNIINFKTNDINIIIDNNKIIWFNANEIAKMLGYKYPKDAIINNVDKDDKIQLEKLNINNNIDKHPHSIYINKNGLYSLLLQSRLKKAKKIKQLIQVS